MEVASSETGRVETCNEPSDPYWARYGAPIDMDNPNDSRGVVLGLVDSGSQRILELGCSAGYMTKVMSERGHSVTAVEIDPVAASLAAPYAEHVLVGDLDHIDDDGGHLLDQLGDAPFDTLIAADVLEHLRNPVECLRRALDDLTDDGTVILSIPNVAHGDIRLALLAGDFSYRDNGLLDRTHVQLFTLDSLLAMIREVGLAPVAWHRSVCEVGESEIVIDENLLEFGRRVLADDSEATTYQWIVTCRRAAVAGDDAVWPEQSARSGAVDGVLALMNQPVPHPGAALARLDTSAAIEVAEPSMPKTAVRRLRSVAGRGRALVASMLER